MNLNIFNPEHDIALAFNRKNLMVPHAAQELRQNLGFIAALWAADGDCVLVDDISFALKASRPFKNILPDVLFVEKQDLKHLPIRGLNTWGWDCRIKAELEEAKVPASVLPTEEKLNELRALSSRQNVAEILTATRESIEGWTCGESFCCTDIEEAKELTCRYGKVVAKAPWSSSGRGVRYLWDTTDKSKMQWAEKTIRQQGCIEVEPYYNRVVDFAMEFSADVSRGVKYEGLSVFSTTNGRYTGNVVASEEYKRGLLQRYVAEDELRCVSQRLEVALTAMLKGRYTGPLGVDMMIVTQPDEGRFLLHPCVEVNLRRTMGFVALDLARKMKPEHAQLMSIVHDTNYTLKTTRIEGEFVNVL